MGRARTLAVLIHRETGVTWEQALSLAAIELRIPTYPRQPWTPEQMEHLLAMRTEREQGRWGPRK